MNATASTLVVYPRGEPAIESLCTELGKLISLVCLSGVRLRDLRGPFSAELKRVAKVRTTPLVPCGDPWRTWTHSWLLRDLIPGVRTLLLTRPDQLPLLALFPKARKVYFALDDYGAYDRPHWLIQERQLLKAADEVVTVSTAAAELLIERCPAAHVSVSRNAMPEEWIPAVPCVGPRSLPAGVSLPRPVAGVIGRISSRLRLDWLSAAIEQTPWLHWLFLGDPEPSEVLPADRPVLASLRQHPRCLFVGRRPYHSLPNYAAALDVAVLPYSDRSTNPCGSPMRLFLHLPFAAPMIATPGCLQLEEFSDLVRICPDTETVVAELCRLRALGFDDGKRELRWQVARRNTWTVRAEALASLIRDRQARAA